MAGVQNTTARQFNLKTRHAKSKSFVTVRLAPGLNAVPDETWAKFKGDKYVNERIKVGDIKHGKDVDAMLASNGADTVLKVKEVPDKPGGKIGQTDGGAPSLDTE